MQKLESLKAVNQLRLTHTKRLCAQFNLQQKMKNMDEEERNWEVSAEVAEHTRQLAAESASRMGGPVAVGQVRLLADTLYPTYVAVIKEWGDDMYLVSPFSHYNWPGTRYEFLSEYDGGMHCRVIQAWMTQTLHGKTLERSWVEAGELSSKDLEDAFVLWHSTFEDVDIPDDLFCRTGADIPVKDRDHWLVKYQQEEINSFSPVSAKDLEFLDLPDEPAEERVFYVTDWPFGRVHEVIASSEAAALEKFLRDNAGAPLNMQVEIASVATVPPEGYAKPAY